MRVLTGTKRITVLGLLTALSVILVYLIRFPIFPSASFLEFDVADVTIVLCAFMYGVPSGLLLTVMVSVIQGLTVSAASGWVGIVMHCLATGAFIMVAGTIYNRKRTVKAAAIGLLLGTITRAAVMVPLNLVFTVHFYGVPHEAVVGMLVPVIIPFNLIRSGVNSVIGFIVYKAVERAAGQKNRRRVL